MPRKELFKRYVLFFISVVFQGIAIALITYADIGTTPISSANYVLSLHSDFTLGDTTFVYAVSICHKISHQDCHDLSSKIA